MTNDREIEERTNAVRKYPQQCKTIKQTSKMKEKTHTHTHTHSISLNQTDPLNIE